MWYIGVDINYSVVCPISSDLPIPRFQSAQEFKWKIVNNEVVYFYLPHDGEKFKNSFTMYDYLYYSLYLYL
jgi:hypothetical protein